MEKPLTFHLNIELKELPHFYASKTCRHNLKFTSFTAHTADTDTFHSSSGDPIQWQREVRGVHRGRPGSSPPTLWLIHWWAGSSTTLSLLWQPQPIATCQTSRGIKCRKWVFFFFFFCVFVRDHVQIIVNCGWSVIDDSSVMKAPLPQLCSGVMYR